METGKKIFVEIGSGGSPKRGYIHCDIYPATHVELVCTALAIPFKSESIDEIYARHVLEHLTVKDARHALVNWLCTLKCGGRIDVNVPDLEKIIKQLKRKGYSPFLNARVSNRDHAMASIYGWQNNGHDFHKWGYTYETLSHLLHEAGYAHVRRIKDDSKSGPVNLRVVAEKGTTYGGEEEAASEGAGRGRSIQWLLREIFRRVRAHETPSETASGLCAGNRGMNQDQQGRKAKEDAEFNHYSGFYEELIDDPRKPWSGEYCRRLIKTELQVACPNLEEEIRGKIILDLGGGCTGVLRLFDTAALKIEMDPLIDRYMEAGKISISHTSDTILLKGYSESIPISDAFVDVVVSRNALDHVDDLQRTGREISRVLKIGGLLVLVVDVKKRVTQLEPNPISDRSTIARLFYDFSIEHQEVKRLPHYEEFLNHEPVERPTCYGCLRKKM